jgi:hypothetical protein
MEFNTRNVMIDYYLTLGMIGCEIGVFEGTFSKKLLEKEPSILYLVDPFKGSCVSGDCDGNNIKNVYLPTTYNNLCKEFKDDNRIQIVKNKSLDFLGLLPDKHLDYIYIDGDHSYEGCKKDLEMAYVKVKKNGLIMGHDYDINPEKCMYIYNFGVKRAVDEFCAKHNLLIEAFAKDGCISYVIRR